MSAEPGTELLRLVAVMDRLRSPGGCPWDRRQTHASLSRHLLEETYEVLEALDAGDREHLREELGDLLLQVVFHARLAEEDPAEPWGIDDVARGITDKLVGRHPHVFGDAAVDSGVGADDDVAAVETRWEQQKAVEKGRRSLLDGIPPQLPALARADKVLGRLQRSGLDVRLAAGAAADTEAHSAADAGAESGAEADFGGRLLRLVGEARAAGVDPEAALRRTTLGLAGRIVAAETRSTPPAAGSRLGT